MFSITKFSKSFIFFSIFKFFTSSSLRQMEHINKKIDTHIPIFKTKEDNSKPLKH